MNRYESTKKASFLGIISNLFLLIIKILVSFISRSEAMFADAINSAGDIFSSLMSYIGNKIAGAPSDEDHNFGHGKAEYIFSMLISIFMIVISAKILIDSITSIFHHSTFIYSNFLIVVCLITILIKICLYLYCKKAYQTNANILLKASMKDHRNDTMLTIGTLTSSLLGKYGYFYFDGILGAIISIYIMLSGIGIFMESYKVLMDISLDSKEKDKIIEFILSNKDVLAVKDFYTVATGYKYIAILTIAVDGNLNTFTSHKIADTLERTIIKNFRKISKVIIHVNPVRKISKDS